MAKAKPKAAAKATPKTRAARAGSRGPEPAPQFKQGALPPIPRPPSRAAVTKAILDDLTSPLVPADAAELFAVLVMDRLKEIAPEVLARFDRSWFEVFVDLAVAVTARCPEEAIAATCRAIEADQEKATLLSRVLRRRFARSLPAGAVNQLDDAGRYWLSVAAIDAVGLALRDEELWDALWGRKAGWFPVPLIAREPPPAEE
jgi:hypothetical protein